MMVPSATVVGLPKLLPATGLLTLLSEWTRNWPRLMRVTPVYVLASPGIVAEPTLRLVLVLPPDFSRPPGPEITPETTNPISVSSGTVSDDALILEMLIRLPAATE